MRIVFFPSPAELRRWLERHHAQARELWVGFYKRASGRPSVTWPEVVDQALCFGWIDGIRKSIDDLRYTIRLAPRKPRSIWSAVNIKRARQLQKMGLMHPSGLKAFQERDRAKSQLYSYERKNARLPESYKRKLKANQRAWTYFQSRPWWYQRTATWWIMSAKKEETRLKRLAKLIEDSSQGRPFRR
jgi:uncharacterized protein YdeI (YjbR/CyaY-like superfamily)